MVKEVHCFTVSNCRTNEQYLIRYINCRVRNSNTSYEERCFGGTILPNMPCNLVTSISLDTRQGESKVAQLLTSR